MFFIHSHPLMDTRIASCLDYCKLYCPEHWGRCILFKLVFSVLLAIYPGGNWVGLYISSICVFFEKPLILFHSGFTHLHFHWQCMRILFPPHSHQHLLFVFLFFDDNHYDRCEVIFHCSFSFLFLTTLSISLCAYWPCITPFEKCLFLNKIVFWCWDMYVF